MRDKGLDWEVQRIDSPEPNLRGAAIVLWIAFLILMASVGGALYAMGRTSL